MAYPCRCSTSAKGPATGQLSALLKALFSFFSARVTTACVARQGKKVVR
jgi:hypothetical protein